MFPTVEARWFRQGEVSPEVASWFHEAEGDVDRRPRRVDHYLRLKNRNGLGIKLREGRIEVKQRNLRKDAIHFHQHAVGAIEHWRKWSFPLAGSHQAQLSIAVPEASWTRVSKERRLLTYRLTEDGRVVVATSPRDRSDVTRQGCVMELTGVRVGGQDWWTLAFEAFGDEPLLEDLLFAVARHLLAARAPPVLNISESWSYADWLRIVAQEKDTS